MMLTWAIYNYNRQTHKYIHCTVSPQQNNFKIRTVTLNSAQRNTVIIRLFIVEHYLWYPLVTAVLAARVVCFRPVVKLPACI